MPHFTADHWIDYARNLLPAPVSSTIDDHLQEGCRECQSAYETWRLVVDWSSREILYQPPEHALRIVKAAFTPVQSPAWLRQAAQFATVVFDSFLQPSTASVRSAMQHSRQLVHDADPFTIDLRLEADPAQKHVHLAGQILDSHHPETTLTGVDVVLLRGADLIAKALANPSGEFQMKYKAEGDLQLFINIRGERAIGIDLPPFAG